MSTPASPQPQPDRNVEPNDVPSEETVAATDEFFKQQPSLPLEPQVDNDLPAPLTISEEDTVPSPEDGTARPAIGYDYVRELQQEFEEQQEEGKILKDS